jgi:hypothetical protein
LVFFVCKRNIESIEVDEEAGSELGVAQIDWTIHRQEAEGRYKRIAKSQFSPAVRSTTIVGAQPHYPGSYR